jgi:putative DNA primase/helicase
MSALGPNFDFEGSEEFLFGAAASVATPEPASTPASTYSRLVLLNLGCIPIELKKYDHWIVWREDPPSSPLAKPRKTPLCPRTQKGKGWTEPQNWTSQAEAIDVYTKNPSLTGIGFVFSKDDPFVGIDLDKCRNSETGEIAPWALEQIRRFDSYTEISPSQTGVKIIARGNLAGKENHFTVSEHEVEIYETGRYFALTGQHLPGTPDIIHDRQTQIDLMVPKEPPQTPAGPVVPRTEDAAAHDVDSLSDNELLARIERSKQGPKFKQLMIGSTEGYTGYFGASGALCTILAQWTRCNPERMDRLYRMSGLFEESWWAYKGYAGRSRGEATIASSCALAASGWMYKTPAQETPVEASEPITNTAPQEMHLAYAGIKDMPESVLDGWLGQICKSRMLEHFPVAYAWTALVTVASALVPADSTRPGMRCNLYGCPVGGVHTGKTEAIKHAKLLLGIQSPPLLDLMAGSAEMLTSAVAEADGRPRLYSPDELGHLLEKAQIQNSSFVYLLNRAFYETGFRVRSMERNRREVIFNATLSIVGGVVEERFGDLFTSKTTGGFYDRFLYGMCPTGFRYFYVPFEGGPALRINSAEVRADEEAIIPFDAIGNQPVPVTLDKSVFVEVNRWLRDDEVLKNPDCGRIVEIALRVATICASFDRRPVLYGKDLGPAFELARYQARIRGILKPNPGKTFEGQLYHKFFEFLMMHTSNGAWITRRELFRGTHAEEIGLTVAGKALDIMIANGDVEEMVHRPASGGRAKSLVRLALAKPIVTNTP